MRRLALEEKEKPQAIIYGQDTYDEFV